MCRHNWQTIIWIIILNIPDRYPGHYSYPWRRRGFTNGSHSQMYFRQTGNTWLANILQISQKENNTMQLFASFLSMQSRNGSKNHAMQDCFDVAHCLLAIFIKPDGQVGFRLPLLWIARDYLQRCGKIGADKGAVLPCRRNNTCTKHVGWRIIQTVAKCPRERCSL